MARPAGVPAINKRKLMSLLRENMGENWHPVLRMAEMAEDPENSAELRGRMMAEVAGFVTPKLKSVEHSGEDGGPIKLKFSWGKAHD